MATDAIRLLLHAERRDGQPPEPDDVFAVNALVVDLLTRPDTRRYFGAYEVSATSAEPEPDDAGPLYTAADLNAFGRKPCPHCRGGQVLEIRVQLDQKVYADCLCTGRTIADFARQMFAAGYKRCEDDTAAAS